MENNFDNFDDLVKKKLDGMNFSFNEANWQKASEMIDATRPSKKAFGSKYFLASSILIIGALAVSTVYFVFNNLDVKTNKESLAQTISKDAEKDNQASENYPIQSSSNNNTTSFDNSNENNTLTNQIQTQEINPNKSADLNSNTQNNSVTNSTSQNNSSAKINLSSAKQSAKGINSHVSKSNNSSLPVGAIENAKTKSGNSSGAGNNSSKNPNNVSTVNPLNSASTNNADTDALNQNSDSVAKTDSSETAKQSSEENAIAKVDSASTIKKDNDYVKIKHHVLNIEAGVINSFGWKVNGIRNGNNLSPLFGINYIYNFNPKSSVLIGAQYNSISNLTESHVSFSVTSYNFGLNNDVTTYKITNLQYIVMPVKYIYNIDESNSIGAGINTSYLLNIRNKIETNKSLESNVQETAANTDNGYGYEQVNRLNAQLALSYSRKISKKIGVNVEINKTMMNVIKDYNYFGSNNNGSKPIALKLGFTYNLINK